MPHFWPQRTGGTIHIEIEAELNGRRLSGHYHTSSDGLTPSELSDLMRERLQRATPPQRFVGQLVNGKHSSQQPPPASIIALADFPYDLTDYVTLRGHIGAPDITAIPSMLPQSMSLLPPFKQADLPTTQDILSSAEAPEYRLMALIAHLHGLAHQSSASDVLQPIELLVPQVQERAESAQKNDWFAYAKQLMSLASVYAATSHTTSTYRDELKTFLLNHITQLTGQEGMVANSIFAPDQLLFDIETFTDPRLACLHSAAGYAALALLNESADPAQQRIRDFLNISLRSVHRYLEEGIGSAGAPIGHSAHDEMLEIVIPFILAWESVSGQNIARGTGIERTGSWLALTDGIQLRSQHYYNWLSFSRLIARHQDLPLLSWYAQQHPAQPQNLWQQIWCAVKSENLLITKEEVRLELSSKNTINKPEFSLQEVVGYLTKQ